MKFILWFCLFLVVTINYLLACECGLEGNGLSSRIYNGQKVRPHKYPWIVYIRVHTLGTGYYECSGSLIDDQHIVTAAHCVTDKQHKIADPDLIKVYLGLVESPTENTFAHRISKIWIDPEYNLQAKSNDFAILTLASPVEFDQTVAPICLPNIESGLSNLTICGWGWTSIGARTKDLYEAKISFLNKNECNDMLNSLYLGTNRVMKRGRRPLQKMSKKFEGIAETKMCAINKETGSNVCPGDSGGPLMHKGDNGLYYLMGVITSRLGKCGEDGLSFYTRIFHYRDTIKKIAPNSCWKYY